MLKNKVAYPPRDTNNILLCGIVECDLKFDHEFNNTKMYSTNMGVLRASGFEDTIPVYISDKVKDFDKIHKGSYIGVSGIIRSALFRDEHGVKRTRVFVLVNDINEMHEELPSYFWYKNEVVFEGTIFKNPTLRKSKSDDNMDLCELVIETHKGFNKYSHIPSIAWGDTALGVSKYKRGTKVQLKGRLQSRYFIRHKSGSDIDFENGVSYEVSISDIGLVDNYLNTPDH